jgi:hypothetical protein
MLSCIAGCAVVSGRGYYTAGPPLDVPGRLQHGEAVLLRPAGMSEMSHDKAVSAPERGRLPGKIADAGHVALDQLC